MSTYTAKIVWKSDSSETFTKNRYTRGHTWEFDGGVTVPASSSPQVVPRFSVEAAVDPEEALVASAASCHMLTFLYLAAREGFNIAHYTDNAVGEMSTMEDGRQWMAKITLDPQIEWIGEAPTAEQLASLHENAHKQCYIANSIKAEIFVSGVSSPHVSEGSTSLGKATTNVRTADTMPDLSNEHEWVTGRAGMLYRNLAPDSLGSRVVVSHIRLPLEGEVPDYVHYHKVEFQLICCIKGRIKVVYEDQGPPFWLGPGDWVIQPPEIRYRVLECTKGAEVVEISVPPEHETWADNEMKLPTAEIRPDRIFGGQKFVHYVKQKD